MISGVLAAAFLLSHEAKGAVSVPRWFGDGMVFQVVVPGFVALIVV